MGQETIIDDQICPRDSLRRTDLTTALSPRFPKRRSGLRRQNEHVNQND